MEREGDQRKLFPPHSGVHRPESDRRGQKKEEILTNMAISITCSKGEQGAAELGAHSYETNK